MLRKSGPLWAAALTLLAGCDLFSTREILPKPSDIRSFQGLFRLGDSLTFRVTESLRESGSNTDKQSLSERRMVFAFKGDSLVGGDTLKVLSLRIRDDSTRISLEETVRVVRFSKDGISLASQGLDGGVRYFPLKASAVGLSASQAMARADSLPPADTASFLALPALLVEGWNETRDLGIFRVRREQIKVDTLKYQGHLEEAWEIRESILSGESLVGEGIYRYGISGLLQADQTWSGFDWRDGNGSKSADVELRRSLVRL